MNEQALRLRHRIMRTFADTGDPPSLDGEDPAVVESLVDAHVIVLDGAGRIRMAHPFAAHDEGTSVTDTATGRTWRGNCPWDAYGIAAALDLEDYELSATGDVFHVAVPARCWWDDVGYT